MTAIISQEAVPISGLNEEIRLNLSMFSNGDPSVQKIHGDWIIRYRKMWIKPSSLQLKDYVSRVETYIELVKNDGKKVLESIEKGNYHVRHNLSVEEKRALSTLKENKQIIIKSADKGGSIVVLDRDYYMREIRTQLRDIDTYQPIGNNPTFEISKEIKDLVTHYTTIGIIDTKLGDFLVKQHPDQFFIQKKGTAMGSNVAPPYANIFMDHFELTYVYTHPSFMSHVIYWRRYIDDVFLIWTSDIETLCQFHEDLNLCLPGLTFSISYDPVSMNFLDTRVTITEHGEIETDLFVKSTDRNSLLRYDSCHPHHIKRALPKSQHVKVDRIVSNPETSHIRHQEMNDKFRTRGTRIMFFHLKGTQLDHMEIESLEKGFTAETLR
ncbi:unnamed protein product [Ranitomeya imitator]|uniref:Helix-turn-helix domain-containing protein n=1 Tax=Ranitomeya imitator TaxID=111125 RepID=A0ABN9L3C8_9NEOB|nr:unnamed protein product [Ranitomeya imitator]